MKSNTRESYYKIMGVGVLLSLLLSIPAFAAGSNKKPQATAPVEADPEAGDLDQIRNRYWAQGNETEMGVVQNRTYTKQGKVESWIFGGLLASDPFLSVKSLGFSLGYHFNEQVSVDIFGYRNWVSDSSALEVLHQGAKEANTNPPRGTVGADVQGSLLYGKLSLVGKKILYYDMHVGLGAATTATESGNYFGPVFSIGQSVYVGRNVAFRVDYRMVAYRENIIEKQVTQTKGQVVGQRNNFSNSVQIGMSFLWGGTQP
jgi:outer membrane beta-barrel protein